MSCRRAISATRLPSTSASAKIRTFSSTDQRRRRSGPDKISWRIAYLVDDVHNDVANDVNYPPKPSAVRRPKSAGYLRTKLDIPFDAEGPIEGGWVHQ